MIPKKIHYIWLGKSSKPNLVDICINSWREKLPGYEIIEWNEDNLDFEREVSQNKFLQECLKRNLWAFLSDYFRIKVLYEHGGIYLDTDMQIVKDLDNLLKDDFFIGFESPGVVSAGIIASKSGHSFLKRMLEFYEKDIWTAPIYTIPAIITWILEEEYGLDSSEGTETFLKDGIKIYPAVYFYPYHFTEEFTYDHIKENTYGIHWWGKSWGGKKKKLYFLEFKHYRGIKKILVNILIYTGLMGLVKEWSFIKFLNRKVFK